MKRHGNVVMTAIVILGLAPLALAGQAPDGWTAPRTDAGYPDLQGTWANDSATPFQRPEALGNRATLTEEEVAAMASYAAEYDRVGGDAVFGDTPFLRALASLEEPENEEDGQAAQPVQGTLHS